MNEQEMDWKLLISAYADDALPPENVNTAEALLHERAECRAYLAEIKKMSVMLHVLKEEPLSPDGERNILKKVKPEGTPMKANQWKIAASVSASVLVVLLVATNIYTQRAMQGRLKSANILFHNSSGNISSSLQYEPYMTTTASVDQSSLPMMDMAKGKAVSYKKADNYLDRTQYSSASRVMVGAIDKMEGSFYERDRGFDQYQQDAKGNTEEYSKVTDNPFKMTMDEALSTFSIDVDTASYANVRRYLINNQMPPKDAARIEEMINYFSYDYPKPEANEPFSVTTKIAVCPWKTDHQLFMIGLKGKTPDVKNLPPSNLVFLIDSSGSMQDANKLPLLQQGFKLMVQQLRPEDKVSIVVYAGSAGKILEPTSGDNKEKIIAAIDQLQAGGSTAGGAGIALAYQLAKDTFIKDGNNRVILATDGDFNVGISSTSEMERMIEEKRKDGIFLTVLGFGQDNLKDARMETIADKGNGNYYYIDSLKEARKVLVTELGSTLFTIAKDVKIQIEFNPGQVKAYRLIGYENRMLAKEDFNNDQKDAGEIGAGHTVTALYEIVPADSKETFGDVDALKYQKPVETVASPEMLTVKLRYKEPTEDVSKLISKPVSKTEVKDAPTGDFAWAASVAEFGMLLRGSEFKGSASYDEVLKRARANVGEDKFGFRAEFITLVENAQNLAPTQNGQINFK